MSFKSNYLYLNSSKLSMVLPKVGSDHKLTTAWLKSISTVLCVLGNDIDKMTSCKDRN
jgi:hypothetical protein